MKVPLEGGEKVVQEVRQRIVKAPEKVIFMLRVDGLHHSATPQPC